MTLIPSEINTELNNVKSSKATIKNAIESKGVTVETNTPFSEYADLIEDIVELKGEIKTITPTTSQQTITPSTGKNGITEVTVDAVTAAIDSNIIPANIKVGTTILGVEGTNQGGTLQAKTLTVGAGTPTEVTLTPDIGNYGLSSVTVDMDYIEDELDDILSGSVVTDNTTLVFTDINDGVLSSISSTFKFPDNVTSITANLSTSISTSAGILSGTTYIDFNNVTSISGSLQYFMYGNSALTTVVFRNVETLSGSINSCFYNCTNLNNVTFPELTTINTTSLNTMYVFRGCTSLTSLTFPKLTTVPNHGNAGLVYMFAYSSLQSLSFPAFTSSTLSASMSNKTQLDNMLQNTTGCTVHFPSNLQSIIGACDDVINGFGGTDTVVLFDLPATT